jgi:protoporphyrinogen/coproporphyrinogen III oxidase
MGGRGTTHAPIAARLDHGGTVRELTDALSGQRLALTGNYFDGLAIEDCVQRSFGEWARVARGARGR